MSAAPEPQPTESLDYATTAARLAEDLATVKDYSQRLKLTDSLSSIDQVARRMREHRFTVAVVGEFKTGKSTFVNSLLGVDVLPTDVVPATATLNRMTYGLESSIDVVYKDGHRQAIGFDKLKEFVTKEYVTTDLLKSIDEVVVHHPAPYLLNNVDIIDTPGLNDDDAMTEVSLSVLPKTDAAILVISALSPFGDYTRQFLEERLLSADLGRVVFLVNRLGQVGSEENADRVLGHIEKRIAQNVLDRARREFGENSPEYEVYVKKIGKPRVFGIDAHDALSGIVNHDQAVLTRSRFPLFQNGLRRFLNEDRGAVVLQVPVNRILASANEILAALALRRQSSTMTIEDFNRKREAAMEDLNRVRERKRKEMDEVERKKIEATAAAIGVLRGADERVKEAVRNAILAVELTDDEVAKSKTAGEKVQSAVNTEVRRAAEAEAGRAAAEVNRMVAEASDQLQKLTADVDQTVNRIIVNFGAAEAGKGEKVGAAALGAAGMVLGGFGVVGSMVTGYQRAGLKGALTGGVVSFGAIQVAALLALAVGLPFTLPVALGAAIAGFFAGDKVTKALFRGARAQNFKEKVVEQTLKQIAEMRLEDAITRSVREYAEQAFSHLSRTVSDEVDAVTENIQRTLTELAREKERQDVLSESQVRELDQMSGRIQSILENTMTINRQLTAFAAGAAL